jgi:hypothetical protein
MWAILKGQNKSFKIIHQIGFNSWSHKHYGKRDHQYQKRTCTHWAV